MKTLMQGRSHDHLVPVQVFDGHGGVSAAAFAERHLLEALLSQTSFPTKPADALVSSPAPMHAHVSMFSVPSSSFTRKPTADGHIPFLLAMHACVHAWTAKGRTKGVRVGLMKWGVSFAAAGVPAHG